MQNPHQPDPEPLKKHFIRQKDLLKTFVPFSATTLWRKIKAGEFPAPIKLGPSITAWRGEEIEEWVQSHSAKG
jgi:predicted DNA-binding transcriptional regulator AlpA